MFHVFFFFFSPALSHERRDHRHVRRDVDDVRADGPSRRLPRHGQPMRDDLHGAREARVAAGPRLVDPSVSAGLGHQAALLLYVRGSAHLRPDNYG